MKLTRRNHSKNNNQKTHGAIEADATSGRLILIASSDWEGMFGGVEQRTVNRALRQRMRRQVKREFCNGRRAAGTKNNMGNTQILG